MGRVRNSDSQDGEAEGALDRPAATPPPPPPAPQQQQLNNSRTNNAFRMAMGMAHRPIPIREASSSDTPSRGEWCTIVVISVVATSVCFVGISLLLRGESNLGVILVLGSGGILMLTVCAARGKCKSEDAKTTTIEDRPPSYRLSWRRSFMRRAKELNSEDAERGLAEPPAPQAPPGPAHWLLEQDATGTSTVSLFVSPALARVLDVRNTQSLSCLQDPPSYQDAVTTMDEEAKMKLQSDLCLPCHAP